MAWVASGDAGDGTEGASAEGGADGKGPVAVAAPSGAAANEQANEAKAGGEDAAKNSTKVEARAAEGEGEPATASSGAVPTPAARTGPGRATGGPTGAECITPPPSCGLLGSDWANSGDARAGALAAQASGSARPAEAPAASEQPLCSENPSVSVQRSVQGSVPDLLDMTCATPPPPPGLGFAPSDPFAPSPSLVPPPGLGGDHFSFGAATWADFGGAAEPAAAVVAPDNHPAVAVAAPALAPGRAGLTSWDSHEGARAESTWGNAPLLASGILPSQLQPVEAADRLIVTSLTNGGDASFHRSGGSSAMSACQAPAGAAVGVMGGNGGGDSGGVELQDWVVVAPPLRLV